MNHNDLDTPRRHGPARTPGPAPAVRFVESGRMTIVENVVGFEPPALFAYASRNGSLPVDDFAGEFRLDPHPDGLRARHRGGFSPKIAGTGWLFRLLLRAAQGAAFRGLGTAYEARYGRPDSAATSA